MHPILMSILLEHYKQLTKLGYPGEDNEID